MRKIITSFTLVLLLTTVGLKAQNLINYWDAYDPSTSTLLGNGVTGTAGTQAKYWGWSTNPATAETNWNTANGTSNIRFFDNVSGYATGRILYMRWDGVVSTTGKYYFKLDTINVSQLTASHSYTFTWSYAWNSNGSAPTITTSICTAKDGSGAVAATSVTGTGAAISGTNETFPCNTTAKTMTTGSITFIAPTTGVYYISFGANTASLCAVRDLSLVDNGVVSYMNTNPAVLAYTPNSRVKTLNISGGGLSSNITLSTKTNKYTLSQSTLTAASVVATGGVNVDITSTGTSDELDTLSITSGSVIKKVPLSLVSSLSGSTRAFFCDQSTQDTLRLTVSGDMYNDISLSAPAGVSLVNAADNSPITTITKAEAFAGKVIKAKWDKSTRIDNKKITLVSGLLKDSVVVNAIPDNVIPKWDADTITLAGSSLAAAGWTQTDASGNDLGALTQLYNTTGGMRIVPIAGSSAAALHTYLGKLQAFGRTAYLRTWGAAAPYNSFNLSVALYPTTTYVFRGVLGWHNNGSAAPNVTVSVNTAKSGLGTTLGSQVMNCATKQAGYDFSFEFTTTSANQNYLVITCDQPGDAMISPDYLTIYSKNNVATATTNASYSIMTAVVSAGNLLVNNAGSYNVFNVQGLKVAEVLHNNATVRVKLNQGVYIVKSDNGVQKIIVR